MVASSGSNVVDCINNLDAGNPLHVQNSDNTRNKYGFVDGSCLKKSYATSDVLSAQWDICNAMKELNETYDKVDGSVVYNLLQKINSVKKGGSSVADYYHRLNSMWREFDALTKLLKCTCKVKCNCDASKELGLHQQLMKSMQFLMGLDDCYQPIRSSRLIRDPLPENAISFAAKTFNNNRRQVNNNNNFTRGSTSNVNRGSIHANMEGRASFFNGNVWFNINFLKFFFASSSLSVKTVTMGWIIDSGANQHLTGSTIGMFNIVDISEHKIYVGHPNVTLAILLSINKLIRDSKMFVGFYKNKCYIQDLEREKILRTGSEFDGLYLFDVNKSNSIGQSNMVMTFHVSKVDEAQGLGHLLIKAKQTREPFPLFDHKSKTLVDDYSRAVWVYLVKTKDEVFDVFISFLKLIHNQFNIKVKVVRSDNETEFVNKKMFNMFSDLGIFHQTSCTHTPQQNGIAKRKHRHLLNVARSLIFQGGIPLRFWSDYILTVVYLINRLPSSVLNGLSHFELVYKKKPNLSHLRSFGCLCFSAILNNHDKMSFRSEKCVLIVYSTNKKAYKLLSLDSRNVFYSRDVKFYENVFPFEQKTCDSTGVDTTSDVDHLKFFDSLLPQSPNDDGRDSSVEDGSLPHSEVQSVQKETQSDGLTATQVDDQNWSEGNSQNYIPTLSPTQSNDEVQTPVLRSLNKSVEPNCLSEAMSDPNWVEAVNNEIEALNRNNTWTICNLPAGRKPIGSKWIWKIKYKASGDVESDLHEDVYMTLPDGYNDENKSKVFKYILDVTTPLVGGCAAPPFNRYTVEEADHKRYRCGSGLGHGRLRRRLAYGKQEGAYAPTVGPYGEGHCPIGTTHPPLQAGVN
ncbi:putative RNA-directed DNA polymerase [Tanacetum coccineum]